MKSLRDYLEESEHAADNPVAGDAFAINIREECLIESVVIESRDDGVVIAADDRMIELLESYGYTFEENCMECGMSESDCGCDHEQVDEIAPVLGAIARTAIPFAAGVASVANSDETNENQDPGEYDDEGDMAKNELYTMIRSARKLIGMLDDADNMPEWTQKKITKATDYVDTAADYISSQKERGVMEQGVAADISGLGPDAQSLILKLRRDVEEKRLHPTPQAVLAAARELAGDMEFAPLLLVQQVLGKSKGVAEGSREPSPVVRAVLHRIMMQHTGLLGQYGPERVMAAVDELADRVNIGPDDEIGSSDVSAYVREVERALSNPDLSEQGGFNDDGSYNTSDDEATDFDEYDFDDTELGEAEVNTSRMNQQHKDFYKQNPHFKRNDREMKSVGNRLATRVDPANPQQVQKKPATPFGMTEDLQADDGERYRSADDFFGQFEADHFDEERVSPDGMEVRGYIDGVNVMVWRFNSPRKTSGYGIYDDSDLNEAEYQGRKVPLGKKMKGDVKKSKVYVKNPQGNVVKVNFGDPNMKIRKSNPGARKSFRARHNCDNPGPRHKARYWSCRSW